MHRRVFSYARVSTGGQAQRGEGLQRQQAQAEAWAAARGLVLDDTLQLADPGRSASKGHHLRDGAALARFLETAKAGELGQDPILLIEDFTRLSRLEPLDSLDQIVSPLVRAGVEIVTLEDNAHYTLERLNKDPACLLILVVKSQAAADYARRLSGYIADRRAKNRADILAGKAVCTGWAPSWIEWDPKGQAWRLTPYVATVRRLVELSWEHGNQVVTRILNEEGHRSPSGKAWSQVPVRSILRNCALHGARRIAAPGHAVDVKTWKATCTKLIERYGKEATLPPKPKRSFTEVPDTWPSVITPDEHAALLAKVAARATSPQERGRRDRTHYVGQQITTCVCGGSTNVRTTRPRKRSGVAGDIRYIYLQCSSRERASRVCTAPPIRVEPVHAALLTRLRSDELAQALGGDKGQGELVALLSRRGELEAAMAAAEARAANAAAALRERAMAGAAVVAVYEEAVEAAAAQVDAARAAVAEQNAAIRDREARPATDELKQHVEGLLQAFARGEDTPEQRRAINTTLRKLDVRIVLDTASQRLGLAVGDASVRWQPISPLALHALGQGRAGVSYLAASITLDDLQKATEGAREGHAVQVPAEFFGQPDFGIPEGGIELESAIELNGKLHKTRSVLKRAEDLPSPH